MSIEPAEEIVETTSPVAPVDAKDKTPELSAEEADQIAGALLPAV